MKRHAGKTKIGILLLALIVALGGMGGAFAAWTDIITIQGTITTADIDWDLTVDSFTWECEPRSETAWALPCGPSPNDNEAGGKKGGGNPGGGCNPGGGWGQYFTYIIGAPTLPVPLYAAQDILIGEVTVSTDGDDLIVEYDITSSGWQVTETHLYVGKNPPPKMAPGQFPYGSSTLYDIPLDSIAGYKLDGGKVVLDPDVDVGVEADDTVYIAAHAVVTEGSGDCDVQPPTIFDHSVVVTLTGVTGGSSGDLCFNIGNIGTIPIRISDIDFTVISGDPDGVNVELLTPDAIGWQLHPDDIEPVLVCMRIHAILPGDYIIHITVNAVQWNLYP